MQACKVHINTAKMVSILNPISKLLKTPVLFYATESKQWFGASKRNLPFCYMMERSPVTNAFCTHCDQQADEQCARQKNAYAYHCHAGLIEVACPVYIDNTYVGFLIIGQFRTKRPGWKRNMPESWLCYVKQSRIPFIKNIIPSLSSEPKQWMG